MLEPVILNAKLIAHPTCHYLWWLRLGNGQTKGKEEWRATESANQLAIVLLLAEADQDFDCICRYVRRKTNCVLLHHHARGLRIYHFEALKHVIKRSCLLSLQTMQLVLSLVRQQSHKATYMSLNRKWFWLMIAFLGFALSFLIMAPAIETGHSINCR